MFSLTDVCHSVIEAIPPSLLPWITHQTSLTEHLQSKTNDIHLQIISQSIEAPDAWDIGVVGLQPHDRVVHRNIIMWADQQVCWFARTIIPIETYQARRSFFDRLQRESLGALIFHEPSVTRDSFLFYDIDERCYEYEWLRQFSCPIEYRVLWARFSAFSIQGETPFYLVEIFISRLERYLS